MKNLAALSIGLFWTYSLAGSLYANEEIKCKSPDGKFALRLTFDDLQPLHGDAAIIETGTKKVAVQLNGDQPYADSKLVWSKDSRRVASFRVAMRCRAE